MSGLYPKEPIEALRADEMLDAVEDITNLIVPSLIESNPEKKTALQQALANEILPYQFSNVEKVLARNGSAPFLLGGNMSIGDFKLTSLLHWVQKGIEGIPTDLVEKNKRSVALREAVMNHPKIKEYNQTNPYDF
eukprot:TRINITY_DN13885_c0_g1_i2.p1 TRINITY_DN13885_c0_g1~~TRINITY_DN13885_c0_g1_i2.p1  ORF type:complete len:135 (-),score=31.21 TRINITY_DN13885_c0_g1_i2:120-524(-)